MNERFLAGCLLAHLLWAGGEAAAADSLTEMHLESCWVSLLKHDDDGVRLAYQNMRAMILSPDSTVPFLKTRLMLAPQPKQIEAWLAALDSDRFAAREEATEALRKAGPHIERVLVARRKEGKLSLEADHRVAAVLADLKTQGLRARRAVEILFAIDTREARQMLHELAKGAADSPVTAQAKLSLRVLETIGRPDPPVDAKAEGKTALLGVPHEARLIARKDTYGDPLPAGAVARVGTTRLRHPVARDRGAWMRFAPDGRTLASIGDDVIRLWEPVSGRLMAELRSPAGERDPRYLASVTHRADGRTVAGKASYEDTFHGFQVRQLSLDLKLDEGRPQRGRDVLVPGVLVSPDGKRRIPVAPIRKGEAPRITLWAASCWAFSPDSNFLAVTGYRRDWDLALWNLTTGREEWRITPSYLLSHIVFAPDGKTLAAPGNNEFIVWDSATGRTCFEHKYRYYHHAPVLAYSGDGCVLAVGTGSGIDLWEVATGKRRASSPNDIGGVHALAWAPDSKTLAYTGHRNSPTHLVDTRTWKPIHSWPDRQGRIGPVRFSTDGKRLVSFDGIWSMQAWDADTGKYLRPATKEADGVVPPGVSPDGKTYSPGGNQDVTVREVGTGKKLDNYPYPHMGAAYTSDLRLLMVRGNDGRLLILRKNPVAYNNYEYCLLCPYPPNLKNPGDVLNLSPDGRFLVARKDYTVGIYAAATGKLVRSLADRYDWPTLAVSADASRLLTTDCGNGPVRIWDAGSSKELACLSKPQKNSSATFSPNGKIAVTWGEGGIWFWDATNGKLRRAVQHDGVGGPSAFSPDSGTFAVGAGAVVLVYDVARGQLRATLKDSASGVIPEAFSPDGRRLATRSADGTVLVWDLTATAE